MFMLFGLIADPVTLSLSSSSPTSLLCTIPPTTTRNKKNKIKTNNRKPLGPFLLYLKIQLKTFI